MAQCQRVLWITTILLIFVIAYTTCNPVRRRKDLIDGKDFLSIYIKQISDHEDHDAVDFEASTTEWNPVTTDGPQLVQDDSNGELLEGKSSNHFGYNQPNNSQFSMELQFARTTPAHGDTSTEDVFQRIKLADIDDKVVKLVTSGSKIIFFEDEPNSSNKSDSFEDFIKTTNQTSSSDDIKVISVSITSSVGKSRASKPFEVKDIAFRDSKEENFISNAHNSALSIEEDEPVTQENADVDDSANVESSQIHNVVAAPSELTMPSRVPAGGSRTRTQRKQDLITPFQTVIIHDQDYSKEGNAPPRSVSYSSVAQRIEDLKTWQDIAIALETQNVTTADDTEDNAMSPSSSYQSEPAKIYSQPSKMYGVPSKFYSEPSKVYSEPAKFYGEPEKIYSLPAKVYSEPAKIYSQPSKIYSEPSKMYGIPSRVYGEPSKFYSLPAGHYADAITTTTTTTSTTTTTTTESTLPLEQTDNVPKKVVFNLDRLPYDLLNAPAPIEATTNSQQADSHHHHVERKFRPTTKTPTSTTNQQQLPTHSLVTRIPPLAPITEYPPDSSQTDDSNGQDDHQSDKPIRPPQHGGAEDDDSKVGYVVEGRNYRKYRVEEKTSDGFIVGEYGVVSHNDGSLRGVRYTADSTANPQLIYEALMKFLSL